ncbi:MAG: YwiC-like family protein [Verrucomicrobia bacterium]|nr:YwiC-like family protein [Verrucomicrobiota bacterium]
MTASKPSVFLPKEHGSWSLALEPLLLGLLIAPSTAGAALAGSVLAGFFARRPLKASFAAADPRRRSDAREALVMWMALALAGLIEAGALGGWHALRPLVPAGVLGLLFACWDGHNDARSMAAELAGSAAFALVPAAVVMLAGKTAGTAFTLMALMLARNLPAVLTVRTCLRAAKGTPVSRSGPILLSGCAAAALALLGCFTPAPRITGVLGLLLFFRTLWLLGPWRPAWPARRIGQFEAALGVLYVLLLGIFWARC